MIKGDKQEEGKEEGVCQCVCVRTTCGHLYTGAWARGTAERFRLHITSLLSGFGNGPFCCSTFTPQPALLELH